MLTAVTEDVYTVGAYMGEDWESFGMVADVGFDGVGNLHILDMRKRSASVIAPGKCRATSASSASSGRARTE